MILVSVLLSSLTADFFVTRVHDASRSVRKLGDAVVLLVASMHSAIPAIDLAAHLATADDGVVLPRLVAVEHALEARPKSGLFSVEPSF